MEMGDILEWRGSIGWCRVGRRANVIPRFLVSCLFLELLEMLTKARQCLLVRGQYLTRYQQLCVGKEEEIHTVHPSTSSSIQSSASSSGMSPTSSVLSRRDSPSGPLNLSAGTWTSVK